MATILKHYIYDYDPTGRNDSNLIKRELHTITPENRTRHNVVIPKYAPFFRKSLEILDMTSGYPLIETIDYTVEWPVADSAEATEGNETLYSAIQFIDETITGTFAITYRTIGGNYTFSATEIAQALANQAADPLNTTWQAIIGKPLVLPPLEHVHSIRDFVNFDNVVAKLDELVLVIQQLAREDRDNHPGYDTLIDEYFRMLEQLAALKKQLESTTTELNNSSDDLNARLTALINQTIANINNQLAEQSANVDRDLEALRNSVNNSINLLTDTVNNNLDAFKTEVKGKLQDQTNSINESRRVMENNMTQLRTDLTNNLNAAKSELERQFNAFKTTTNETLQEQARSMDSIRAALAKRIDAADTKNNEQDTTLTNHGNRITTIENTIRGGGDFVRTVNDQTIDGTKTFVKPILLQNTNDATKIAKFGFNQNDIYLYNAVADKYFSIGNTGIVKYGNRPLAFLDEVVHLTGNQDVAGVKTFTNDMKIKNGENTATISSAGNKTAITNSKTGKTLILNSDGNLVYDNQRVILLSEFNSNNTALNNSINALKTRLDNQEFVKTEGNQTVNGRKKFTTELSVIYNDGSTERYGSFNANNDETYIYHSKTQKRLSVKSDGHAYYDSKKLIVQPDLDTAVNNLNTKITALQNLVGGGDFVRTSTEQTVGGQKWFTAELRVQWMEGSTRRYGGFNASESNGTYMYNSKTGNVLRLSNAGKAEFNGRELINASDIQNITGRKNFKAHFGLLKSDDDNSVAVIGFNNNDVHFYNPVSNKYLQMRNTGALQYQNEDVILRNEFNTLKNLVDEINAWKNSITFEF